MKMPTETKPTTEAVISEAACCPFASATLFSKGLERAIEASKTSLDLADEQNAEILAYCKEALNASSMPGSFLFDLAGRTYEDYIAFQKSLLDLTLEQSHTAVEVAHEYRHAAGKAEEEIENAVRKSVDRTEAAQRTVLDLAKEVSESVMQQRTGKD